MANNRLLNLEEMKKAIWDMGVEAEKTGGNINQLMRFNAIKSAQDAKTSELVAKEIFEELEYEFGVSMPTKMGQPCTLISIEIIDSADRGRYQTLKKKYGV